jgi:ABC-2 type transport system ATP-binding protein
MILIGRGKIVASGTKQELLAGRGGGTHVMALDIPSLTAALRAAGFTVSPAGGGLRVETDPVHVGEVAAEKQIVLTDLRPAEGGLENLFLELTADTQRESVTAEGVAA